MHVCAQLAGLDIEHAALCLQCDSLCLHDIEIAYRAVPILLQCEVDGVLRGISRIRLFAKRGGEEVVAVFPSRWLLLRLTLPNSAKMPPPAVAVLLFTLLLETITAPKNE